MSCDGGHLGFPIGIKNSNLVKDIPMIIPLQFGFSQFISFGEEDLWNFSQSEHIIGPGSHIEYPTGTKNSNFVEDHPRNIPAKFGSNRPSGFGEEAWNVKSLQTTDDRLQTTDDGRQVMAIVHMDLWSRWTKNEFSLHIYYVHLYVYYHCLFLKCNNAVITIYYKSKVSFLYGYIIVILIKCQSKLIKLHHKNYISYAYKAIKFFLM
jgi:hypothetical protein